MGRIVTTALMVLALALTACGTVVMPSPSAAVPSPSASIPDEVAEETPEPSAAPSASAPALPDEHPATGLALVQFPGDSNDPASQVFVVEHDGTLRQVTGFAAGSIGATFPVWSPDRSQIAYGPPKVGFSGVTGQVSVVNADGSGERVLSEGELPRWSPDGTHLLVAEVDDVTSEPRSLGIVDVATGELTDLGIGFNGQWLSDTQVGFRRIVETADGSYADSVSVMDVASGETQDLAIGSETETVWSPDGSVMLIAAEQSISIADADGSNPRDLVGGWAPSWSPDGSRVLFGYEVNNDGLSVMGLVDLDGNELWSGVAGSSPTWSPDGTRIAIEVIYPEPMVQVLDAATGELLWEVEGSQPNWGS